MDQRAKSDMAEMDNCKAATTQAYQEIAVNYVTETVPLVAMRDVLVEMRRAHLMAACALERAIAEIDGKIGGSYVSEIE